MQMLVTVDVTLYSSLLCLRAAMAHVRLSIFAGLSEDLILTYAIMSWPNKCSLVKSKVYGDADPQAHLFDILVLTRFLN